MNVKYAIAVLAVAPALFAARQFDDKVRGDFFAGFAGNQEALDRGMAEAEKVIAVDPQAAEALAWHGSGLLVMASGKFRQGDMAAGGQLWGKAIAEMDRAGEIAPDNPAILVPRAATWLVASRLAPPQMGKPLLEKGLADYQHVYQLQQAFFDKLGMHMRSELLFGLADGYARDEQPEKARGYFTKLAALGPRSGHSEQAAQYLQNGNYKVEGIGCAGCHIPQQSSAANTR